MRSGTLHNWFDLPTVGPTSEPSQAANVMIALLPLMPFRPVQVAAAVLFVGLSLATLGCKRKRSSDPQPGAALVEETPREADPVEAPIHGEKRCSWAPGGRAFSLRAERASAGAAEGPESPFAVELGGSVAFEGGFAVGLLREGRVHTAGVAVTDGHGRTRLVELGEVHGAVDPPRLALHGNALLVVVNDSDAQGSIFRVARIAEPFVGSVVWGPEVQEGRDDSAVFAVAAAGDSALLVWDAEDGSTARSHLMRLIFDPVTLKALGAARPIKGAGVDAGGPALAPRPGGHWLVWSTFQIEPKARGAGEAEGRGLLDEPRVHLRVAPIDVRGEATAPSLDLGERQPFTLDVAGGDDGGLVLALRTSEPEPADTHVTLVRVRPDGSFTSDVSEHADMAAGAPVLLRQHAEAPLWLAVRGGTAPSLLGRVHDSGSVALAPELLLHGREPLVAGPRGWLLVEPHGLDLDLRLASCPAEAAPGSP